MPIYHHKRPGLGHNLVDPHAPRRTRTHARSASAMQHKHACMRMSETRLKCKIWIFLFPIGHIVHRHTTHTFPSVSMRTDIQICTHIFYIYTYTRACNSSPRRLPCYRLVSRTIYFSLDTNSTSRRSPPCSLHMQQRTKARQSLYWPRDADLRSLLAFFQSPAFHLAPF